MKQIHILLLTILFCCGWQKGYCQDISSVSFTTFGGDIQVSYQLNRLPYDSYAVLNLYVSTNEGVSFTGPLVHVRGDIGTVSENGQKRVFWRASDEMENFSGQVVFEIRGKMFKKEMEPENLLMYNVSGSSYAGLMYGRIKGRWGGFLRAKTDFAFANAPYDCMDDGVFNYNEENTYYNVNGISKRSRLGITAGALFRPGRSFYLYAGAGYGFRRLMWQADVYSYDSNRPLESIWAVNTKHSAEGLEVEAGGIFRYKNIGFSAGMNTINMDFVEVNGAIGFFF